MEVLKRGQYSGDVKTSRNFDGVVATITQYDPNEFNDSLHYHENPHLGFTLLGGCVEKKKQEYELSPGGISCYLAGEKHRQIKVHNKSTRFNIELEPSFCLSNGITERDIYQVLGSSADAKFAMVKIYRELVSGDEYSTASAHMILLALFKNPDYKPVSHPVPSWIKKVQDFLHDQYCEEISLSQIAAVAGVHPVTVSKYFPNYVGCTLGEYLRKLRIERALHLINASGDSLTRIAYHCGFFDQSHFTRSFKKYTGSLPKEYRH